MHNQRHILSVSSCDIKEIDLKDMNTIYKHHVFLYNMIFQFDTGSKLIVDSMKLVDIKINSNEGNVIFKFINMNKISRKDFRKFSDSYTEFILFPNENILNINWFTYFIIGNENSKEIIDSITMNISKCQIVQQFLYFLYNKFKNDFQNPIAGM